MTSTQKLELTNPCVYVLALLFMQKRLEFLDVFLENTYLYFVCVF